MKTKEPVIKITGNVFMVRGQKVVSASAAASFYGVSTSVLMRAISRNRKRFPMGLMFYLTKKEISNMPTLNPKPGNRYLTATGMPIQVLEVNAGSIVVTALFCNIYVRY